MGKVTIKLQSKLRYLITQKQPVYPGLSWDNWDMRLLLWDPKIRIRMI